MKILWVKTDYLHPTTRGGQIRTLEMLRCLHQRHEIHYVCLTDETNEEGRARCHEYCTAAYPVYHSVPSRHSMRFAGQLISGVFSELPVSVARYRSRRMRQQIEELLSTQQFDSVVCDFLFPAPNIPNLSESVLFQHNVEAKIWQRHAGQASNRFTRAYLALQARRMQAYEQTVCRSAKSVVAVSERDCETMQSEYQVRRVSSVPTGVDLSYFTPPDRRDRKADLVFVGSMDWLPNIDAAKFFLKSVLPKILTRLPDCRVAFVGRNPEPWLIEASKRIPNLVVTGTVPDVRPWLWGSAVSVVPLRIGGGTRLKIFEAMAAQVPVISTTVGAEGLPVTNGSHLVIEDDPDQFADACVNLMKNPAWRTELAREAWQLVATRFSWEAVSAEFEQILFAALFAEVGVPRLSPL